MLKVGGGGLHVVIETVRAVHLVGSTCGVCKLGNSSDPFARI
jgi:hypothetical protein